VRQEHHELSTFARDGGKWYFVSGKEVKAKPVVRAEPKIGRNDPCSCGSGRKYKKCCGA
jgi:SEC-C motif-containing protein